MGIASQATTVVRSGRLHAGIVESPRRKPPCAGAGSRWRLPHRLPQSIRKFVNWRISIGTVVQTFYHMPARVRGTTSKELSSGTTVVRPSSSSCSLGAC
jgi:hypothetical protein